MVIAALLCALNASVAAIVPGGAASLGNIQGIDAHSMGYRGIHGVLSGHADNPEHGDDVHQDAITKRQSRGDPATQSLRSRAR
jgi:hypothetical protein